MLLLKINRRKGSFKISLSYNFYLVYFFWRFYRHYRFPTGNINKMILSMERGTLRKLVTIVMGHVGFGYHLKRMGILSEDTCRLCMKDDETASHVVCQCPALTNRRLYGWHVFRLKQMMEMTSDGTDFHHDNHQV